MESSILTNENMNPLTNMPFATKRGKMDTGACRQPLGTLQLENVFQKPTKPPLRKQQKSKKSSLACLSPPLEPELLEDTSPEFENDLDHLINKYEGIKMNDGKSIAASKNMVVSKYQIFHSRYFQGEDTIQLYFKDVLPYMRVKETHDRPVRDYIRRHEEISVDMRLILIDWLVEVAEEYKFNSETLSLAIYYLDRFLSILTIAKPKFQLLGIAALFAAAKVEEVYMPSTDEFIYITDNTYTKDELFRMERIILKALRFNMQPPTPIYFLRAYLTQLSVPSSFEHLSQYLCELGTILGDSFLEYLPSQIATAALVVTNFTFGLEAMPIHQSIVCQYKLSEVVDCVQDLFKAFENIESINVPALKAKYSSPKYSRVAVVSVAPKKSGIWL